MNSNYKNPDVLVSTQWVADRLRAANIVIAEVDVDTNAYNSGHIAGAVGWNWQTELADQVQRDIMSKEALEALLRRSGVNNGDTIVLYGDNNNWFAAWAFWQLKIYSVQDVRLMDGGRKKWLAEGRPLANGTVAPAAGNFTVSGSDLSIRSMLPEVQQRYQSADTVLVDVRSADEFTGKILAPPGLPETCQRGGHIPGARNIGWGMACNEDGTFKSYDDLKALYEENGVTADKKVITYCRIGERSSHSWFVLKYLLGYDDVRNYDGSWTEWGNLVAAPVARG